MRTSRSESVACPRRLARSRRRARTESVPLAPAISWNARFTSSIVKGRASRRACRAEPSAFWRVAHPTLRAFWSDSGKILPIAIRTAGLTSSRGSRRRNSAINLRFSSRFVVASRSWVSSTSSENGVPASIGMGENLSRRAILNPSRMGTGTGRRPRGTSPPRPPPAGRSGRTRRPPRSPPRRRQRSPGSPPPGGRRSGASRSRRGT